MNLKEQDYPNNPKDIIQIELSAADLFIDLEDEEVSPEA